MTARDLGALRVPALGFGAMVLSGVYGEVDDARAEAALTAALDAGAVHVDTSDAYGADGDNERLVGRLIKGRRDEVVVATKFGLALFEGEAGRSQPVGYAFGELRVNAEPRLVRRYAERSLRNLGVDAIDLYYAHYPDPGVPIEETVGAMAELVKDGLVKHIGLSNVTAAQVRAAHAVHPVAAVQNEWSMWRPIEPELLATTRELGIGVVAWSPLGNGFLTGTVQGLGDGDFRHHAPRFSTENLARNNDRYAPIRALAGELEITPAQLALAWLLHQDEHVVAIPGSRTPAHIRENAAAAGITLDPATLARVDQALAGIEVTGGTLL